MVGGGVLDFSLQSGSRFETYVLAVGGGKIVGNGGRIKEKID